MKILKKIGWFLLFILGLIAIAFLLGPTMKYEKIDNTPLDGKYSISEVEKIITDRNNNPRIKADNEEKIIWADGIQKTEYAFIYLHGFSASHEEGAPIHANIADRYGANLYLSRLPRHGLNDSLAFLDLTPKLLVDYAKEAIKIGKSIGEKVIVISCSTGSTLSAFLAANDPDIYAQIMFSPNFELHDKTTKLLTKPWGLNLARRIKGGNYHQWNAPARARPFWNHKYRLEGVIALQSLIDDTMEAEVFREIKQPIFVGYFYKDEQTRDFTVSTEKIQEVEHLLGTPEDLKEFIAYPDGKKHVFISPLFNENWERVQDDVIDFLDEKLKLEPIAELAL
ncbi:alpha/beta hydrolase [Portibacter lacus]|uniref:Alpha/beta hydrolase n=1 Tax=Portibacter lacus TaxID=1099794 RepID=A0AA37SNG2_9BACT|nr:alpha/beta hydrolase [Portibacter lacus]GLR15783.1 hypothetical protein GCM10007940_03980 [Portibacter lacus]